MTHAGKGLPLRASATCPRKGVEGCPSELPPDQGRDRLLRPGRAQTRTTSGPSGPSTVHLGRPQEQAPLIHTRLSRGPAPRVLTWHPLTEVSAKRQPAATPPRAKARPCCGPAGVHTCMPMMA